MTTTQTLSGLPAEEVKQARGSPLKTFSPEGRKLKDTGTKIGNRIGTFVCLAILIGLLWRFWDKYQFLGREMFRERNKRSLLRLLLPLGAFFGYASSLGEGKSVKAEVYEKGFRLQIGKKEYAYEYKDIPLIQRSLRSNGPTKESTVNITLTLLNGEKVKFGVDENNLFLNFSKMLLEQHRDYRQESVLKRYEKGETIDFESLQVNKTGIEIGGKQFARTEISELVPTSKDGGSRDLYIKDVNGKNVGTIFRDAIYNDYVLNVILEKEGIKYR